MAEERAAWCLLTGQSWDLYPRLTRMERQAFQDVVREANRRR